MVSTYVHTQCYLYEQWYVHSYLHNVTLRSCIHNATYIHNATHNATCYTINTTYVCKVTHTMLRTYTMAHTYIRMYVHICHCTHTRVEACCLQLWEVSSTKIDRCAWVSAVLFPGSRGMQAWMPGARRGSLPRSREEADTWFIVRVSSNNTHTTWQWLPK